MDRPLFRCRQRLCLPCRCAGAFGAHGLRNILAADALAIFETGVRYQMYHALALLAVGLLTAVRGSSGTLTASGWLFVIGTIIFSGSLLPALRHRHPLAGRDHPPGRRMLPRSVGAAGSERAARVNDVYSRVEAFQVQGEPGTNSCKRLTTVSHVTHINFAAHAIQEQKIKAGLVFDESRLNQHRVLVTWLSPNDWIEYIYGTVKFEVDWATLVEGKNYYWVECMHYSPRHFRILVTSEDRSSLLEKYIPELRTGPWWYDKENDAHYFNRDYTLEIMLEDDIPLKSVQKISTVTHHSRICTLYRGSSELCEDINLDSFSSVHSNLVRRNAHGNQCDLAFLAALGRGDDTEAGELAGIFSSKQHLRAACTKLLNSSFHVDFDLWKPRG